MIETPVSYPSYVHLPTGGKVLIQTPEEFAELCAKYEQPLAEPHQPPEPVSVTIPTQEESGEPESPEPQGLAEATVETVSKKGKR